jgi:hypothetical protein
VSFSWRWPSGPVRGREESNDRQLSLCNDMGMQMAARISFAGYRDALAEVLIYDEVHLDPDHPPPVKLQGVFVSAQINTFRFPAKCLLSFPNVQAKYDCVRTSTNGEFELVRVD